MLKLRSIRGSKQRSPGSQPTRPPRPRLQLSLSVFLGLTLILGSSPAVAAPTQSAGDSAPGRPLSLEARLACQTAIEEVNWAARLWPAENPEAKPSLWEVLPATTIRARVELALRQSNALAELWYQPITGEMLQAEMERMAASTSQPERLRALWAALNDDPYLVAECLARPLLADRLVRSWYAQDDRFHGELRTLAEAMLEQGVDPAQLQALDNYREATWVQGDPDLHRVEGARVIRPADWEDAVASVARIFGAGGTWPIGMVSELQEDNTRFYALVALEQGANRLRLGIVEWPKTPYETWWQSAQEDFAPQVSEPAIAYELPAIAATQGPDDTWEAMSAVPFHTGTSVSVWTGTYMIVWGGAYTTEGYRYDPAIDEWKPITTVNAPGARYEHTGIWTGTEMIVWGGCNGGTEFCTDASGGRYNPDTDTWQPTSGAGAPNPRRQHAAVWSGSEMIVWGGCTEDSSGNQNCKIVLNSGGRYSPATDTWAPTSLVGAPAAQVNPNAVWAGSQMIIWNGSGGSNGRYHAATDTWTSISTAGAPQALLASLNWTGSEMLAWGGCLGFPLCNIPSEVGGRYDPVSDVWTSMSGVGAPSGRFYHSAVWDDGHSLMLVWGGTDGPGFLGDGARYSPASDSWSPITETNAPSPRSDHQAHWTGSLMLIWGGVPESETRAGSRYDPLTDSWTPMTTNGPDRVSARHSAIWTGAEMVTWGGEGEYFIDPNYGAARRYDPATDTWTLANKAGAPEPLVHPEAVWTGTEMIVWGGQIGNAVFNLGGRYNPTTDSWLATTTAGAPEGRVHHIAVWTGTEMIVWGGSTWENLYDNQGGRYDPVSDSWDAVTLTGAPTGRYLHTGVWTGDSMVIWGGMAATGETSAGGRYDPVANAWTPTSLTGAPVARSLHTAVWTGSEMIVWGGFDIYPTWVLYNTGGRYDPTTDTWTPTSTTDAPPPRSRHTAIWTGQEMIVWSGCTSTNQCLGSDYLGGRYSPASDSWQATTTVGIPEARQWHTAVWTGSQMLIWGGQGDRNGYLRTGSRYNVGLPSAFVRAIYLVPIEPQPGVQLVLGLVRILDGDLAPIAGATVDVEWTLPVGGGYFYPASKPTKAHGLARFFMVRNWPGTYELCVTDLTAPGYVYDPGMNLETCDSLTQP